MDTLLQADIFFFVTTMAIVVVTIAILIALFVFIQILRDVRYTTKRIREETDRIVSSTEGFKELIGGVLQVFRRGKRVRKRV